jgi:nucleolar GTP-binding protein
VSSLFFFSMRKIKFTQQTISERLTTILTEFPRLNDIHPFYADLCNTLYDRDHYKLALGQINTARSLVDAIARDMIRMVKYGDSLYRCKCLKRAALGRMCTVLKRQKASLAYLEEVRKHMSRLPALDPTARTILMCGLPNVGKSSFMNKITRGNVDVQPYAFTTKSLFVGHCDYSKSVDVPTPLALSRHSVVSHPRDTSIYYAEYLRWQVIDTPGILDHSLEERNTIEMQAIIALAHLTCSVLYFLDISEQCGYTIEQQCSLFRSIKPLFANKQLIVAVNKIDQQPWETLDAGKKAMVEGLAEDANCSLMKMSNISEEGVSEVKIAACDKLLESRVDARVAGKKVDSVMNRLQVFTPAPRDNVTRQAFVPDSVKRVTAQEKPKRSKTGYAQAISDDNDDDDDDDDDDVEMAPANAKKTARDLMWENGGPGVWAPDYREQYLLEDESWRFDRIPEIIDGKNIADFVDPEILKKLETLEKEEEQLVSELEAAKMGEEADSDLDSEEEAAFEAIKERKTIFKTRKEAVQTQNKPMMPHAVRGKKGALDAGKIKKTMDNLGVDSSKMIERGRSREREDRGRKRDRSLVKRKLQKDDDVDDAAMEEDYTGMSNSMVKKAKKENADKERRVVSEARSHSKTPEPRQKGLKDKDSAKIAQKLDREGRYNWTGASGEGDHRKTVHLVKWMNTGKKRNGTSYCR